MFQSHNNKLIYEAQKGLEKTGKAAFPLFSRVSGYMFLGRKKRKTGVITTTKWLTFLFFPLFPMFTYEIEGGEADDKRIFPRVFELGEFVPYELKQIELDYFQVLSYTLLIWVPIFSMMFFFFIYPKLSLAAAFVFLAIYFIYQFMGRPKVAMAEKAGESISALRARLAKQKEEVRSEMSEAGTQKLEVGSQKLEAAEKPEPLKMEVPSPIKEVPKPKNISKAAIADTMAAPSIMTMPKPFMPDAEPEPVLAPKVSAKEKKNDPLRIPEAKKKSAPLRNINTSNPYRNSFASDRPIHVREEEHHGSGWILLGFLNLAAIFYYFFCYGYFSATKELSGYSVWAYKAFALLGRAHLISFISFNVGLFITLFRNKFIGLLLIVLAVVFLLGLDVKLWTYVLSFA